MVLLILIALLLFAALFYMIRSFLFFMVEPLYMPTGIMLMCFMNIYLIIIIILIIVTAPKALLFEHYVPTPALDAL